MSVVGIDFGAQSTKIGVARNKGIDIVRIHPIFFAKASDANSMGFTPHWIHCG
jgi:sugar (pentulose or hexulose) kinase